jgi:hypothetical protein
MRAAALLAPFLLTALIAGTAGHARSPAPVELFEKEIRPLLAGRCLSCHSGERPQGGLDLTSREKLLAGGASGPVLVPGRAEESLLVRALRHQSSPRMPPDGKLLDRQVEAVQRWVEAGAPWGVDAAGPPPAKHWAFQPVREPEVPRPKRAWGGSPIDRFLMDRLEREGLEPAPWADRRTLIQRATFDLIGLPPTPEEVEAFLADRQPGAFARVVDRLLASPHYGERWGRHWLDVARYSDSNGLDWNELFAHAWRYRDYVVRVFNEDRPFDQFIREQLAGDLLPGRTEAETYERQVATGFLVMGPKLLALQDRTQLYLDVVDEQVETTTKAFLGLTVSCARCHDHKFDPIPTRDYYALAGIFKSTRVLGPTLPRNARVMYWMERPLVPEDVAEKLAEARRRHAAGIKEIEDQLKQAGEAEKLELERRLAELRESQPQDVPMAMAAREGEPIDLQVHLRGSYENLGEPAPRGFLTAVEGTAQPAVPREESGRRELAEWIASRDNPLPARVMVNRIWQHHFGRGLVGTPDNFGLLGEAPTHPELLDWLARRFVEDGWSVKKMHRRIMLSAAYQMRSTHREEAHARDPDNTLLWRQNRRRLEAEAIRDRLLAASGELDLTLGGSLLQKTTGIAVLETPVDFTSNRRSLYLPVIRGNVADTLQVFDFPDPHVTTGRRDITTVAPQALLMLNSPFVLEQAAHLAWRVMHDTPDRRERVRETYRRTLGREPTTPEIARALRFVARAQDDPTSKAPAPVRLQQAWEALAQALFASTEFRYVD